MKSRIDSLIKSKETEILKFKPDKSFYQKLGINFKRFGLIRANKIEPSYMELKKIADYFGKRIEDLVIN